MPISLIQCGDLPKSPACGELYAFQPDTDKKGLFQLILLGEDNSGQFFQFPHLGGSGGLVDMGTIVVETEHGFEKKNAAGFAKKATFPAIIPNRSHVDAGQEVQEHLQRVCFPSHKQTATTPCGCG